ncbi:MAG: outer membrane protein assembly factor [Crocinitomicaceae bacterium]|nr:outer membrane protein assembly factor [Crocinitomicaceae bacterium]
MKICIVLTIIILSNYVFAQDTIDSTKQNSKFMSKFDGFNKKAEKFFKYAPAPMFSYSSDAGFTTGIAKFNVFNFSKKDSISRPSNFSLLASVSTAKRYNVSIHTDLFFNRDNYLISSEFNFRSLVEYIYGIGNDINLSDAQLTHINRFKWHSNFYRKLIDNLYLGLTVDLAYYFNIRTEEPGILEEIDALGLNENSAELGLGIGLTYDSRDNRYYPNKGWLINAYYLNYANELGSKYQYQEYELDLRRYFNPWLKHVIALQARTNRVFGEVPFYSLIELGGDQEMRGYYQGAFRDNVGIDGQIEYRMPIWNIFGLAAWVGAGRVSRNYSSLDLSGLKLTTGLGLRVKIDSKHNTNLRLDFGIGEQGFHGFYVNFSEAF